MSWQQVLIGVGLGVATYIYKRYWGKHEEVPQEEVTQTTSSRPVTPPPAHRPAIPTQAFENTVCPICLGFFNEQNKQILGCADAIHRQCCLTYFYITGRHCPLCYCINYEYE